MNFIFLMDPLETVVMEKDTSFILMLGAHRRGHKIFYLGDGGITRKNGKFYFHVLEVVPQKMSARPFHVKKALVLTEKDADVFFVRSDPPFDQQYLFNTWLLDLLPKHISVINNPAGIRTVNEKIWATQFTSIIPKTLVGRHKNELLNFLKEEKDIVAKPTDGHGGQSVFRLKKGDTNTHVILETLTERWTKDIILQKFVPQSKIGDKRILLLNGEPLGAVLRVHAPDDHRNNFFAGGKAKPAVLTPHDRKIIEILKPKLRALGLYFVGIDIMGNDLIEVNVTSPTCLQEMNRLYRARLEEKVIALAEKLVDRLKK